MASRGHTSTQARQPVQRPAEKSGLLGAGTSARSGQVTTHRPQAVQAAPRTRVTAGTPGA